MSIYEKKKRPLEGALCGLVYLSGALTVLYTFLADDSNMAFPSFTVQVRSLTFLLRAKAAFSRQKRMFSTLLPFPPR